MLTIEKLLTNEPDGTLLDIQIELLTGVVPTKGYAHKYCRKVNKMIDSGELCVLQYRHVYLPTLAKLVQKELARRYVNYLLREKD